LAERAIRYFFGGNAVVAVVVLALITIFLFREGFGFFGENLRSLRLYRTSGLEYVDIIRAQSAEHAILTRSLNRIRLKEFSAQLEQRRNNGQAHRFVVRSRNETIELVAGVTKQSQIDRAPPTRAWACPLLRLCSNWALNSLSRIRFSRARQDSVLRRLRPDDVDIFQTRSAIEAQAAQIFAEKTEAFAKEKIVIKASTTTATTALPPKK